MTSRCHRSAIAGLLAGLVIATSAAAQPKPALVQDVDSPARNAFQQPIASNACTGQADCTFTFAAVPAGMRLVVTQVSIEASVSDPSAPLYLRVGDAALSTRAAFTVHGPGNARLATFPVTLVLSPGAIPYVLIFVGGTTLAGSGIVTMIGHFVAI